MWFDILPYTIQLSCNFFIPHFFILSLNCYKKLSYSLIILQKLSCSLIILQKCPCTFHDTFPRIKQINILQKFHKSYLSYKYLNPSCDTIKLLVEPIYISLQKSFPPKGCHWNFFIGFPLINYNYNWKW
jgi:hypothetical protein